jgi:hypothetical protein
MRILQDCAWLKLGFDRRHLLIERIIVINLILEPLNCPEILSTFDSDSIPNHFRASLLQKAVS